MQVPSLSRTAGRSDAPPPPPPQIPARSCGRPPEVRAPPTRDSAAPPAYCCPYPCPYCTLPHAEYHRGIPPPSFRVAVSDAGARAGDAGARLRRGGPGRGDAQAPEGASRAPALFLKFGFCRIRYGRHHLPPPPPSRTDWTRLVPPPVLTGHVSWSSVAVVSQRALARAERRGALEYGRGLCHAPRDRRVRRANGGLRLPDP